MLSLFQMSGILELPVLFQKTAHLPVLTTTAPQSWCLGPVTSGQENSLHGTSDLQKGAFRARSREDTASPPPMSSEATQPRFHHIPPTKAITEAHPASRRGDRRLWLWGGAVEELCKDTWDGVYRCGRAEDVICHDLAPPLLLELYSHGS